jgi:hypothetical protein
MNSDVRSWPKANRGAGLPANVAAHPNVELAGGASAFRSAAATQLPQWSKEEATATHLRQPRNGSGILCLVVSCGFRESLAANCLSIGDALDGNLCGLPLKMLRQRKMETKRRMALPETYSTFCQISCDCLPVCLLNGSPRRACRGAGYTARWLDGRFASAVKRWVAL